jgi:hypothetical protein
MPHGGIYLFPMFLISWNIYNPGVVLEGEFMIGNFCRIA